jgi:pimeloyl-ACP methyl ester carboxylesterase
MRVVFWSISIDLFFLTRSLQSYSIPQFVDDLKQVIWQVVSPKYSNFHLYGHSFGGVLAYEYLCSCLSDDTQSRYNLTSTLPACRSVILSNTPTNLGQCNTDYDRLYAKNPFQFWQNHACRVGTPPPLQDAMKHAGTVWMGMDVVADYRAAPLPLTNNHAVPMLVISCQRDFAYDTSNERNWQALMPASTIDYGTFVTLDNCAHYPFYEDKIAYGKILTEFLSPLDNRVPNKS